MKMKLLILTLALLLALPVFGLASDAAAPAAPEVQATQTTPPGGQYGPRRRQTAPETTAPQTGCVDADKDGVCDNCGAGQGKNSDAPNYIDENKDGVCDRFGTDDQGQGSRGMQQMRGRMAQMMGRMAQMRDRMAQMRDRMQNAQGRMQGMMGRGQQGQENFQGRGQQGQGNVQGRNYADTDNDGVCDNFNPDTQRHFGPGRNRR